MYNIFLYTYKKKFQLRETIQNQWIHVTNKILHIFSIENSLINEKSGSN